MRGPIFYVGGSILAVFAVFFLVYLLYLAGRAFRSLFRARRCQHLMESATKKHREGDVPSAVALYLKAESYWSLNSWDGSRESWMKDLDRLSRLSSGLARALAREQGTTFADLNATVRDMRETLQERGNFGVDGRKLLPEADVRWQASLQRLQGFRSRLREAFDPKAADRARNRRSSY